MRWEGPVEHMGNVRNTVHTIFWSEETRLFERPRHRWEDNIKLELNEIG
jgi:hypothetical protein